MTTKNRKHTVLHVSFSLIRKNLFPFIMIFFGIVAAVAIVTLPKTTTQKIVETKVTDCEGSQADDFSCWSQRYTALVKEGDIKAVFTDLRKVYAANTYVQSQCHQITHVIGRVVAETTNSVGKAYQEGDSFCWSGYYHGVVEQVATNIGKDMFISQLNTLCSDVESQGRYSFYHYNCVHGLGHGVMSISDNELFVSLDSCDTIKDEWNRLSCVGGVFMENVMSDPATNPTHTTKYLRPQEPMYPCTEVKTQYKQQCYLMQTSYALRQVSQDFSKVFEVCSLVDAEFTATCYQSLGRDASGNSVSNVATTKKTCELGVDFEQVSNCAIGAVKDFISYYSDDTEARLLCASFAQASVQDVCSQTATEYYKSF